MPPGSASMTPVRGTRRPTACEPRSATTISPGSAPPPAKAGSTASICSSPTNVRTMIAAFLPPVGFGNTLPLLLPQVPNHEARPYRDFAPLLLANLNALIFEYVARQKVQGQHLNFYIVEQLPFVPPEAFSRRFGTRTAEAIIREDVLRLTYTAQDMTGFAADQGHAGPPFPWDPEDRLRRRARL